MPSTHTDPRGGWRPGVALTLALLAARAVYLVWICPYELAADEAHYWEWSRRPALSYYSKGPGVACAIRAATAIFGESEGVIRLPAAVASALATLAVCALAMAIARACPEPAPSKETARRVARAGFLAALLFSLTPAFQGAALLMTIDGPYVAFWATSCIAAWRLRERLAQGFQVWGLWAALGLSLGLGFLFKYTILLLLPGLALFAFFDRRGLPASRWVPGLLLCALVFLVTASPVLVWNSARGWPTVAHLLGRIGAPGGDETVRQSWAYKPIWTLDLAGSQIGLVGPVMLVLVASVSAAVRERTHQAGACSARLFAISCAVPILLFHLALTFVDKVQGNWPIAGYVSLVALAGERLSAERSRRYTLALRFCMAWGLATGLGMLALQHLVKVPGLGRMIPLHRVMGHRVRALVVKAHVDGVRTANGEPLIITDQYATTSLLAYYLPGRPRVYCASHYLGGRASAYDYFADTDLLAPGLRDRPAVLVGGSEGAWRGAFSFSAGGPHPVGRGVYTDPRYGGPLPGSGARP